jgi:hypothetical protein
MSSSFSASSTPSSTQVWIVPEPNIVTVIQRFDVPPAQQADFIKQASDQILQYWKASPEFIAVALLKGRDRGGVAAYAQWRKPVNSPAPATVPAAWSLASALPMFTLLDSRTYTVAFTDSATPPTQLSVEQTPLAHFGIFTVSRENQDHLLDLARENAPRAVETTPGLIAVNFHRSIDGLQVTNVGTWNTFDGVNALLQQPGFSSSTHYWSGVADFQDDHFDLVFLEAASQVN